MNTLGERPCIYLLGAQWTHEVQWAQNILLLSIVRDSVLIAKIAHMFFVSVESNALVKSTNVTKHGRLLTLAILLRV